MAAGDQIVFHCTGATHGTAVAGVLAARVTHGSVVGLAPTAPTGVGDRAEQLVQKQSLQIELIGKSLNAVKALVAAAAANLVVTGKGAGGASESHTFKNVVFSALGNYEFRDPDSGGKIAGVGVTGFCNWGDEDTLALMWTIT